MERANEAATCCENCVEAVRRVIDKRIVFYCMAMSKESTGTLCCSKVLNQDTRRKAAAQAEAEVLSAEVGKAPDAPRKRI